ncbi:MAG: endolytic transglycosylase MltG [Coriobacteriia bacterium]|nr:endolytic transglycosylase MltG [Coriobacteriia bacterium]
MTENRREQKTGQEADAPYVPKRARPSSAPSEYQRGATPSPERPYRSERFERSQRLSRSEDTAGSSANPPANPPSNRSGKRSANLPNNRSSNRSNNRSAEPFAAREFSGGTPTVHAVKALDDMSGDGNHTKHRIVAFIAVLLVAAVLVGGGLYLYDMFNKPQSTVEPGLPVTVTINAGASTKDIAKTLKSKGVIADEKEFRNAVVQRNAESSLKPGTYELTTGMDLDLLITLLENGPEINTNPLTLPEGITVEQTAALVEQACGVPAAEFLALVYSADKYVNDYPFLKEMAPEIYNNSLEGFLYPKTYHIAEGASADDIVRTLLSQFSTEAGQLDLTYATEHNLSFYDVVIIASLIEKETAATEERPIVSSVIYNRLHEGMRLQIDATVVYALGPTYDGHPLLFTDLEVNSPYNTYQVDQLPSGPICSPQLASLAAAAQPDKTKYLYYVLTSKEGFHTFCKTLDEFEEAKAVYREVFGISE